MNPTRSRGLPRGANPILAACALLWLAAVPVRAADNPMPRPPELEHDVQFWIRVYTQVDTNSGFIHDEQNPAVVSAPLHFSASAPAPERQRLVDAAREHYTGALR